MAASSLPDEFGRAEACDGFTTPSLHAYLQPALGQGWRGPGPAMIVNDLALSAWGDPEDIALEFMLVVGHELAHILERDKPYRDRLDASPERLLWETLVMAKQLAEPEPVSPQVPPFRFHGDSFVRTCCHVCYRADRLGVPVRPSGMCAGWRYGLSLANHYEAALGDEPERLADLSFKQILATPAPRDFMELWDKDVARWTEEVSGK